MRDGVGRDATSPNTLGASGAGRRRPGHSHLASVMARSRTTLAGSCTASAFVRAPTLPDNEPNRRNLRQNPIASVTKLDERAALWSSVNGSPKWPAVQKFKSGPLRDPVPGVAGADGQGRGQMGLAGAGRAEQDHVGLGGDEVGHPEVDDQCAVQVRGVGP